MDILEAVKKSIIENEIGGDEELAYMFSDPDGKRTGKSGYSFGWVQFDIENNWDGILCLRACGFRPKDMDRLFEQVDDISDLNSKLSRNKWTVDIFCEKHTTQSVKHCQALTFGTGIRISDEAMVHLIDYHNQFYMTPEGKIHTWLKDNYQDTECNPHNIRYFKLNHTAWGKRRDDDVDRRYNNIQVILRDMR